MPLEFGFRFGRILRVGVLLDDLAARVLLRVLGLPCQRDKPRASFHQHARRRGSRGILLLGAAGLERGDAPDRNCAGANLRLGLAAGARI